MLEDCPAIASRGCCDQEENEGTEVPSSPGTLEAWLRRVRAATMAPLHLGQWHGRRGSGMGAWAYDI
jgi:hypothetical protein